MQESLHENFLQFFVSGKSHVVCEHQQKKNANREFHLWQELNLSFFTNRRYNAEKKFIFIPRRRFFVLFLFHI